MVGPVGLLQPIADVLKLLQKEDIIPADADRALFNLAPVVAVLVSLGAAAVVPFSPTILAADLDVGVLYVLAIGGLMVIPTFAAGWASNNKFALLGAMRAIAQSVSYGVPLVLAMLVPVILAGTMSVSGIVTWQAQHHWIAIWPVIPGLPAFLLFFLALLAESQPHPLRHPRGRERARGRASPPSTRARSSRSSTWASTCTRWSARRVAAALFFGGWDGPFAPGLHWMVAEDPGALRARSTGSAGRCSGFAPTS